MTIERFAGPPDAEQSALARRALSELRFGLGTRDPGLVRAAERIVDALDGGGSFGLFGTRELGPSLVDAAFEAELLRRLEDEFERGRLVVEREPLASLTELRDISIPDLPPLPPARRESTTRTFEVRFVDEIGKAISGIDAEFTADGAQTRATNAAGIALLDGVQSSHANVAILDPDALSKVLDPRWENFRPGKPPKESNTTEVVFRGGELGPFDLKAELPNTVVIKPPPGKLFVELWDKTGRVRHAKRTFQITGPQTFEGETDDDGRLLQEDVFPGDYSLSLAVEAFKEGDPDRVIDIVDAPLVVIDAVAAEPQIRMLGAVPRSVLARLHMSFNTSKTFLLPTALPSLRTLRKLYVDNQPCQLLVVGHADTKAGAAFNDKLSLERAKSVIAYLKDDVEAWFKFYSDSDPNNRWGKVEDHLMIIALPDFRSKPPKEDEVSFFQRTRGLSVDGDAGKDTRHALIAEYMSLDGTSLEDFVGEIEAVAHGCGENFPLDDRGEAIDKAPADEKPDHIDRRVELFFFDVEFGITPKPPAENSKPDSPEYPLWRGRAQEIHDLEIDAAGTKLQLVEFEDVLFDTNSAVPLPRPCKPDGSGVSEDGPSALHDVAASLRFAFCYPDKLMLVAGHTDTTADAAINDPLSEKRGQTVLALLVGERDLFRTTCDVQNVKADKVRVLEWADSCLGFPCAPKRFGGNLDKAIRAFQQAYNDSDRGGNTEAADLVIDGDFGPASWGAVFDLYEAQIAEILQGDRELLAEYRSSLTFVDEDKRSMGFGERFPVDELGRDGIRSQANRRVEVLFFDPKDKPDLGVPLDLSDIYLPGFFVHEPQPVNPDKLEILPIKAARLATRFSNGRTFPKPSALPTLGELARLTSDGHARFVVVGHTDHTNKTDENEALGLARAEAVAALLRQDKAFFLLRFDTPDPIKKWNWEEVQWMLSAIRFEDERFYVGQVDDYPGDLTRRALGAFQLNSDSLVVDHGCDSDTLSLLIDRYFALLDPRRKFQPDAALESADPELSGENRRVDVFAFDQPVLPRADTILPGNRVESATYVRWCRTTKVELSTKPVSFPIRLFDARLVPIANTAVTIAQHVPETGDVGASTSLTTSAFGSLEFTGAVGSYRMTFSASGRSYAFSLAVQPDDVGGCAAIISNALP